MTVLQYTPSEKEQIERDAIARFRIRERKRVESHIRFGEHEYSPEMVKGMQILAALMGYGKHHVDEELEGRLHVAEQDRELRQLRSAVHEAYRALLRGASGEALERLGQYVTTDSEASDDRE